MLGLVIVVAIAKQAGEDLRKERCNAYAAQVRTEHVALSEISGDDYQYCLGYLNDSRI